MLTEAFGRRGDEVTSLGSEVLLNLLELRAIDRQIGNIDQRVRGCPQGGRSRRHQIGECLAKDLLLQFLEAGQLLAGESPGAFVVEGIDETLLRRVDDTSRLVMTPD
jgi:hypothetical protein